MTGEKLHTLQEAAEILRLHPKTVLRFIRESRMPARKIGRNWMITDQELADFAGTGAAHKEDQAVGAHTPSSSLAQGDSNLPPPAKSPASATIVARNQTLESAQRLSTTLLALANSKAPEDGEALVDISWQPALRICTIRLQGSLKVVATLLSAAASLED